MAASVGGGPGLMIVTRERRQSDFSGRETAEFKLLLQQLGGALALGQRVVAERLRSVALDALSLPALIVDQRARLLHANPAALALSARRGVAIVRHRMALPDLSDRPRFVALAAAACRGISGGMPLALSDGKGPLRLRASPLPEMLRPPGMTGPFETAALITVRDLEPVPVAAEMLVETLGLTKAEAQVAALLSQGLSGVDVARRRGVSQETVRTQIESIQAKAGARNLRELVLRLGRLGED